MEKAFRGEIFSHLLWFSRRLKERGLKITTGRMIDALRGLALIDLSLRGDFAETLKANFVSSRKDIPIFEALFAEFWGRLAEFQLEKALPSLDEPKGEGEGEKGGDETSFDFLEEDSGLGGEADEEEPQEVWSYSPDEKLRTKNFRDFSPEESATLMREFQRLISQWVMRMSRRKAPSAKGREMDFRRTIRKAIRHGGEIVELIRRRPKPRPLKVIILCDVSGSMDPALTFILQFFFCMQRAFRSNETFVFSTRLTRITEILKRNRWPEALKAISQRVQDWSGGTRIGACLGILNERYMKGLASGSAILIFISDGWDRGEPELLAAEMKRLKRRARRIIWMNPLLAAPDYEPICLGMRTAFPFIDHFLPVHNLLALKAMGETLLTIPKQKDSL